jgi:hypothetical protein
MGKLGSSWFIAVCAPALVAACVSPRQADRLDATVVQTVGDAAPAGEDDGAAADAGALDRALPADASTPLQPDLSADLAPADGTTDGPPDTARVPVCGNTVIEPGEQCDPPGTCPTSCPPKGCTRFVLQGTAAACTARCVEALPQATCVSADGCCPAGCNAANDSDCAIVCGNGVREGSETCEPLSTCPTSCPSTGCQRRRLINAGTCAAECVNDSQQTTCQNADGCCPGGCDNNADSDCAVRCGNGAVEAGETCDPLASCNAMAAACTGDASYVRTPSGDASRCTFKCTVTPRACSSGDGHCPGGCTYPGDTDCKKPTGQACTGSNSECLSGYCASGFCCDQACSGGCHSCAAAETNGANGTCLPVRSGADPKNNCTAQPATSCQNDGFCDGAGNCRQYSSGTVCSPASCSPTGTEQPAGACSGSGVCNTPPPISCSRTCGAESCGGSSCALSSPYYCMPDNNATSITQCEGKISGFACDGNPNDEMCDRSSTYLYRYQRVVGTNNRYDLVANPYWVCDWSDGAPDKDRFWHEGS